MALDMQCEVHLYGACSAWAAVIKLVYACSHAHMLGTATAMRAVSKPAVSAASAGPGDQEAAAAQCQAQREVHWPLGRCDFCQLPPLGVPQDDACEAPVPLQLKNHNCIRS